MKLPSPDTLFRTYRDPIAWLILAVDLFPIVAILYFGWAAAALVYLYWIENLIIGLVALLKMGASAAPEGRGGLALFALSAPFFVFHYGMFCFVHGVFLTVFASIAQRVEPDFMSPVGLVENALQSGEHLPAFAALILILQLFLFVRDFLLRGEYRETSPFEEMAKPYSRVVVLHVALFAGFGLLLFLGQPMVGVLALILLRAAWGVLQTVQRNIKITEPHPAKVDEASPI